MEFTTILMEGGEWSSFNGASVNEEADFMAKMFPESSLSNEQEQSSCLSLSSSFYSSNESNIGMVGDDNVSFYSTDTKSNVHFLSEGSSLSGRSESINYQSNEIYYVSDPEQILAVNGSSSLPVGFWLDTKGCIQDFPGNKIEQNRRLSLEMSCDSIDGSETKHETMPQIELADEDKSSDSSELKTKKIRKSEVEKGKRNVRQRRSRKACLDDEENSPSLDKEKLGECSYEEEDLNGRNSIAESADNLNVKTRASRGSAVDPQSLYARKRRERINERLRVLQRLVPNGTKVDISTMLEEAVHYVKFLELQIKLLSSDDLWMYAPLAYNGMDIGLDSKLNSLLSRA